MDTDDRDHRIQTICLLALTAIATGFALYYLRTVLVPFVLAVFLVYCLSPAVDALKKHLRFPRPVALITTILLGSLVLFLVWILIWESVSQMSANASVYEEEFINLQTKIADSLPLEKLGIDPDELSELLRLSRETTTGLLTGIATAIMSLLSNGLLVIIFMIFILAGSSGTDSVPGSFREQVETRIKRYILTKVLVSGSDP